MEDVTGSTCAICFLQIGPLNELSQISIKSALDRTNATIFIGVIDEEDLMGLPESPRIQIIKLHLDQRSDFLGGSKNYHDFSSDVFYKIVQFKWKLFTELLTSEYSFFVYSDTDVYWNRDPLPVLSNVFESQQDVQIQIQNFTDDPSSPKLCMGFVAFRVSSDNISFVSECAQKHFSEAQYKEKVGDDDIVTAIYAEKGFPHSIFQLPTTTFPVGRMLKLYKRSSIMPGLGSPDPYVFHANYVVGLANKLILIKLFIKHYSVHDRKMHFGTNLLLRLFLKRIRHFIRQSRNRFVTISEPN